MCTNEFYIYKIYIYSSIFGEGAVSFLFLILKMKCCCLCLWFNHPAPSWLNFASSGYREEASGVGRRPEWTGHPSVTGSPPACPCPRGCGWRRWLVSGVGFGSVLDSAVSGPGEGGSCRFSRLVRFVLLLFNIVSMPGRGVRCLFRSPNKLSHSEAKAQPLGWGVSVLFLPL